MQQSFLIEDSAAGRGRTAFGPARPARSGRTSRALVVALVCACAGLLLLTTQAGASSLAAFSGMPMVRAPLADPASPGAAQVPGAIPAEAARACRTGAEPKMFIYWTIKTAFDSLRYAIGQTDEVKGTGVWGGFEMKRDKEGEKKPAEKEEKK